MNPDDAPEIPLVGGRSTLGVVRIGNTVHRGTGPWTPTVHAFLEHLRSRGFRGAPRPLGFDDRGREILEFIHGDVLGTPQRPDEPLVLAEWPETWRTDEALTSAARLIRQLHDASEGFWTDNETWRHFDRRMRSDEIVCHADHGPWNTVYRDGMPVALIDWDSIRPDLPLVDLAAAAWAYVPLVHAEDAVRLGFETVDYARRLRTFIDAYGVDDRSRMLRALQLAKHREADNARYWEIGPLAVAGFLERVATDLRWLGEHEAELRDAL